MVRYLCPHQGSLAVEGFTSAPARRVRAQRDHANRLDSCFGCFDWLEGATGVRLILRDDHGSWTIRVTGEIDLASVDIIVGVVRDAIRHAPAGVALDLSGVTFIDDAAAAQLAALPTTGALPAVPRQRARG